MRPSILGASAAAALLFVAASASAQAPPPAAPPPPPPPPPPFMGPINWTGPYVGGSVGYTSGRFPGNVTIGATPATTGITTGVAAGAPIPLRSGSSDGITGGAQIGYNWQWNSFVFGAEGDFKGDSLARSTTLGTTSLLGVPGGTGGVVGDNFRARQNWDASIRGRLGFAWDRWLPYVTGGIAFSDIDLRSSFVGVGTLPAVTTSQTKNHMGPTVGGGVEYRLGPNLSVGGEYRYTDLGSETYALGTVPITGTATAFASAPVTGKVSLQTHTFLVKLNYNFNAPPPPPPQLPPPPPPPPAASQQVFLVFFDWDKDRITPAGMDVIRDAAAAWKAGAPVQLQVTGYTDRSGSPGYNQRLSDRRANNVAMALANLGVPRNVMDVHGRGENDNRVPTANGVREPQNRRVEIFYLR